MECNFGNERIVVLLGEPSRVVQRTSDDAHRLELSPGVADGILVDGECLREELVADRCDDDE